MEEKVKTTRINKWVCSLISNSLHFSSVLFVQSSDLFLWLCLICICHSKWWFVYVEYIRVCVFVCGSMCISFVRDDFDGERWSIKCALTQKCCIVECHKRNRTAQLMLLLHKTDLLIELQILFFAQFEIFFLYFDSAITSKSNEFPKWTGALQANNAAIDGWSFSGNKVDIFIFLLLFVFRWANSFWEIGYAVSVCMRVFVCFKNRKQRGENVEKFCLFFSFKFKWKCKI